VKIPHEEHSELQVLQDRFDTEDFDCAPTKDHDLFLLAQHLATEEVVEKLSYGLASKEVYSPFDWGIEYRTVLSTSLWDP
jgi:hypothetical protein